MSKYSEIAQMLHGKPIQKPQTFSASVRLPIGLLASITAMASRANVSRNEMFTKLLDAAVDDTFELMAEIDPLAISEIQEVASSLVHDWADSVDVEEDEQE